MLELPNCPLTDKTRRHWLWVGWMEPDCLPVSPVQSSIRFGGATQERPCTHILTHAHTLIHWQKTLTLWSRGSVILWCTMPHRILPKADFYSYSLMVQREILAYATEVPMCLSHLHAYFSSLLFTHTVNEKQDSWECLARVWSFSQINVSRLQGSREAHFSTQY